MRGVGIVSGSTIRTKLGVFEHDGAYEKSGMMIAGTEMGLDYNKRIGDFQLRLV